MLRPGCGQIRLCHEVRPCSLLNAVRLFRYATTSQSSVRGLSSNRRNHSLYEDTVPPTELQEKIAETFFRTHLPVKSWTATEWRKQPHTNASFLTPEIAFLGRSNSGKSSLLNSLLIDRALCRVGPKPGKTTTMHAWSLGPMDPKTRGARKGFRGDIVPKLTVLDMPGYGHGSRGDWGRDIMKYLTTRKQLRRAFVLVNPEHGFKDHDLKMLKLLRTHGIAHQLIATKCDRNSSRLLTAMLQQLREAMPKAQSGEQEMLAIINDILATGNLGDGRANKTLDMTKGFGLGDVRWAILRAVGLEEYATTLHEGGFKAIKQFTNEIEKPAANEFLESVKTPGQQGGTEVGSPDHTEHERQPTIGLSVADFMSDSDPVAPPSRVEETSRTPVQPSLQRKGGRIRPRARIVSRT